MPLFKKDGTQFQEEHVFNNKEELMEFFESNTFEDALGYFLYLGVSYNSDIRRTIEAISKGEHAFLFPKKLREFHKEEHKPVKGQWKGPKSGKIWKIGDYLDTLSVNGKYFHDNGALITQLREDLTVAGFKEWADSPDHEMVTMGIDTRHLTIKLLPGFEG